ESPWRPGRSWCGWRRVLDEVEDIDQTLSRAVRPGPPSAGRPAPDIDPHHSHECVESRRTGRTGPPDGWYACRGASIAASSRWRRVGRQMRELRTETRDQRALSARRSGHRPVCRAEHVLLHERVKGAVAGA